MPIVAERPTFQKTLQGEAPLMNTTLLLVAVVSVESTWKMKTARVTLRVERQWPVSCAATKR